MKNNKGFTLIELLAVIIILGILMIIAIPSVTRYINDSRRSAYVDTAKEIISGARNFVNEGKLEMFDTDTTYYIDQECIQTENGSKTPYGEFVKAYVIVTYNGQGYEYFWTSVDDAGQGVRSITKLDKLDTDKIESDLTPDDIPDSLGIDGRSKYITINKQQTNCGKGIPTAVTGEVSGATGLEKKYICKRATTLHTGTCDDRHYDSTKGCVASGYTLDGSRHTTTIVYGQLGTSGSLNSGDAYDCDVNNDGTFDSTTERFYYVSPYYSVNADTPSFDNTKAVLIYYSNVTTNATPTRTINYKYYDSGSTSNNRGGPRDCVDYLPSVSSWSNPLLLMEEKRIIRNELDQQALGNALANGFPFSGKAARFLSIKEAIYACGEGPVYGDAYLENCNFFMENVGGYEINVLALNAYGSDGFWLENPRSGGSNVFAIQGDFRGIYGNGTYYTSYGVRPAITISIDNIEI